MSAPRARALRALLLALLLPLARPAPPLFVAGLPLVAGSCASGVNDSQRFALSAGAGAGVSLVTHVASGLCVEAWPGSDLGSSQRLLLQACAPGRALQQWVINSTDQTVRTFSTPILGCLGWNNYGNSGEEGNEIGPYSCDVPASANERFAFDAGTGGVSVLEAPSLCVTVESATAASPAGAYVLDDTLPGALGATFDGVGVSAAGGAARLLFDYEPAARALVLDALFLPAAGGGLSPHLLRIEIGGDCAVLSGAEPAHQRAAGEVSVARGTQIWLALQARQRNPDVRVFAVPHAWPGWLAATPGVDLSPFGAPQRAAAYVADWLATASAAGLKVDFVGVYDGFWDAALVPAYVKLLRAELSSRGGDVAACQIVCGDAAGADASAWACSKAAEADADLLKAVAAFGEHAAPGAAALNFSTTGRWVSSFSSASTGTRAGADLSFAIADALLRNATGFVSFSAVSASYNSFPGFRQGAVDAPQPWSSFFDIAPTWYSLAHYTQFSSPGFRLLSAGGAGAAAAGGALFRGGRLVTLVGPSGDFAAVATTTSAGGYTGSQVPELATFRLGGALLNAARTKNLLHVWTSCFGGSGAANVSLFAPSTLPLEGAIFDTASLWLFPNCVYTLTTKASGAQPAQPPASTPAAPTAFFGQRADDFSGRAAGEPGTFFADVHGAFEVIDDAGGAGRGLQQRGAAPRPLSASASLALTDLRPHTVLGDATWRDADATVRFWLPTADDCAGVGLRVSSFNNSDSGAFGAASGNGVWLGVCAAGGDEPFGYWLVLDSLDRTRPPVAQGGLLAPLLPRSNHSLRLIVRGDDAVGLLDGIVLARVNVSLAAGFPSLGYFGLAAADFGSGTIFGPYLVSALGTTCSAVPREGDEPRLEPCQGGTPGQSLTFSGVPGAAADAGGPNAAGTPGALSLEFNSSLCVTMDRSSGEDYGYARTKRVNLTLCNAGDPRQQFTIEAAAQDGGDTIGPVQGPDGLVLNIYRWDARDDTPLRAYPWQGSSNEFFSYDAVTGSLYLPYEGVCASFCGAI